MGLSPCSPVVWAVWAGRAWIGLGLLRFAGISALGSGLQVAISGWDFRLGFQAGGAGLDSNGLDCSRFQAQGSGGSRGGFQPTFQAKIWGQDFSRFGFQASSGGLLASDWLLLTCSGRKRSAVSALILRRCCFHRAVGFHTRLLKFSKRG